MLGRFLRTRISRAFTAVLVITGLYCSSGQLSSSRGAEDLRNCIALEGAPTLDAGGTAALNRCLVDRYHWSVASADSATGELVDTLRAVWITERVAEQARRDSILRLQERNLKRLKECWSHYPPPEDRDEDRCFSQYGKAAGLVD